MEKLDCNIDLCKANFPHMAVRKGNLQNVPVTILRTSFTGELGFEIYMPRSYACALWDSFIAAGDTIGLTPFGLEALMVMRTEKGFIHVGVDTDSRTIPDDVGFGVPVRKKADDFIGKRSLYRPDALRTDRECIVGLRALDRNCLPMGGVILAADEKALPGSIDGRVTSSYFSPSLNKPIALGMLKAGSTRTGEILTIYDVDGMYQAEVVSPCTYDPKGEQLHV